MEIEHILAYGQKVLVHTEDSPVENIDIKQVGNQLLVPIDDHFHILIDPSEGFLVLTIIKDFTQICRISLFSYNLHQRKAILQYISELNKPGDELQFIPPTKDHFIFSVNLITAGVPASMLSTNSAYEHSLYDLLKQ